MYTQYKITLNTNRGRTDPAVFRRYVAEYVSQTISHDRHQGLPYFNGDDMFWVLDCNNNWFLRFYENESLTFSIEHRYHDSGGIEAINKWIAYRFEGKLDIKTF